MIAGPVLMVELPVPPGREDEWNRWYEQVHVRELQRRVPSVVRSVRYRVVGAAGDRDEPDLRYVVMHEFDTAENLAAFVGSSIVAARWDEYADRWGAPALWRRRSLEAVLDLARS